MEGVNMSESEKIMLPEVMVIAGPNGSGKSTITRMAKIVGEYVNYHAPKGMWLLRALRLYLRSLIAYAILILTGVSTSPLLYRILRSTTLLLRRIFNAPFTSALSVLPLFVLY